MGWLSVVEAAKYVGLSVESFQRLALRHELGCVCDANGALFDPVGVEKLKRWVAASRLRWVAPAE